MDDQIPIYLFSHSLDSLLGLLLRLVKVLLEYDLSGHTDGDCRLGGDGYDGAVFLLRLLLRVEYIEKD